VISPELKLTKNGFESTFGINFLAAAYLTELFLKNNLVKGRIVSISSEGHRSGRPIETVLKDEHIKFGQPWGKGMSDMTHRYDYSKLVQTTYFLGLAKRTANTVIDMCPGPSASDIFVMPDRPKLSSFMKSLLGRIFQSPDQAGMLVARVAVDDQFAMASGRHIKLIVDGPARADARDERLQDLVHEWTQDLIKTRRPPQQ